MWRDHRGKEAGFDTCIFDPQILVSPPWRASPCPHGERRPGGKNKSTWKRYLFAPRSARIRPPSMIEDAHVLGKRKALTGLLATRMALWGHFSFGGGKDHRGRQACGQAASPPASARVRVILKSEGKAEAEAALIGWKAGCQSEVAMMLLATSGRAV